MNAWLVLVFNVDGLSSPSFFEVEDAHQKESHVHQIKEVLRLKFEAKLSHKRIAVATGLSKGAVVKNRLL